MPKTKREVAARALRELAVLAADTNAQAEHHSYAVETADACFAELTNQQGAVVTWTVETVPDAIFRAFALWVAADMAAHFMVAPPVSRSRAIGMVRAYTNPDDREDSADLDDDGAVSDAERDAADKAAFY